AHALRALRSLPRAGPVVGADDDAGLPQLPARRLPARRPVPRPLRPAGRRRVGDRPDGRAQRADRDGPAAGEPQGGRSDHRRRAALRHVHAPAVPRREPRRRRGAGELRGRRPDADDPRRAAGEAAQAAGDGGRRRSPGGHRGLVRAGGQRQEPGAAARRH
ncbi:MAG: hypothetical protein AVDCRST_MAG79-1852, partial [uncultured Thermoleophilia bacterium]